MARSITALAGTITAVLLLCMSALASGGWSPTDTLLGGCFAPPPAGTTPAALHQWDSDQRGNATTIVDVGRAMAVPPRGWVIAVATAMQESSLRNLPDLGTHNDHDSIGLFQQRPSQGWGTPAQLAHPRYAATAFFTKLETIPDWLDLPLSVAAQKVQVSARPDAYAKWELDAAALVASFTTSGDFVSARPGICAAGTWTQPVHAGIVSGFRTPGRPTHDGDDLGAARGTTVVAASAGTVQTVTCNAHLADGTPYSCNRDGSLTVLGCGWYVDIAHPDGVITRYCHLQTRPLVNPGQSVAAGQPIGTVGASGNVTGPHLHFEIHLHHDPSPGGAVDPQQWMQQHGAPLGSP
jgi:murein DD-endopeptidase MepM/ murein hydrolase activator NlpD